MCQMHHVVDENAPENGANQQDPTTADRPENPLRSASFLSRLLFIWPRPLLNLGMQRPLEESDLPEICKVDTSAANRKYFDRIWEKEQHSHPNNPLLHRALLKDFLQSIWFVQPMICLGASAKVAQAVALGMLIQSFEDGTGDGWIWASVIAGGGLIICIEHHHVFFLTWRKGMQLRVAAIAAIHRKSLRLSSTHQETAASYGKIMNLASNDVERFILAALFVSYLFWSPLQSIAILCVGWSLLGPAFAAGFVLLFVGFLPLQFFLSRQFIHYRGKIAGITDIRVNFVSQAVYGSRLMKMSGFEWRFLDRIQDLRRQEVKQIAKANDLKAMNEALFYCANVVISAVIFVVHVLSGESLTPRDVFTTFTLVNIIQLEMTKHVALGVMGVSEAFVSIQRIQKFLEFPELPSLAMGRPIEKAPGTTDTRAIVMDKVCCDWNDVQPYRQPAPSSKEENSASESTLKVPAISDISLEIKMGQLICIVGPVGSGKSALLQALVGELPVKSGALLRQYGTLAYAAQDPWIMDGTVKENILMGRDFDHDWYDQVVNSCGLKVDFRQLRDGDLTVVGDRGVQVSGGQRARIGMARALYQDSDVLVADDPLSAVDARVGRQLFNDGILGMAVNRGKCVILATHQHQHIGEQRCVLMMSGRVVCAGSYQECITASNGKLTGHEKDNSIDNLDQGKNPAKIDPKCEAPNESQVESDVDLEDKELEGQETTVKGIVRFQTYLRYVQAMDGLWVGVFLLVLFSFTQAAVLVTIANMGKWAERPPDLQYSWDILGLIIGLTCLVVALSFFRASYSFHTTIKASRRLHDRMAKSVLRAKIEFFDTNPLGRILNRFSADVGSNDDMLPQTLFDFFVIAFIVLGAVATTLTVLPFTLIAFPPLVWYFLWVRRVFVTSTRELKRLEGLARSPIFAMMSESLGGIATIRANDALAYFQQKFESAHDAHTRAFFSFIASSRWVGFRMDGLMFLFLTLVAYLAVLFERFGWFDVDPAILGLALSMLLQLAGLFQWCIRQSAEVTNLMVSVERVLAFGDLPPEAELEKESDSKLVDQSWPSKGSIEVQDLAVRYRSTLPLALNGANFSIPGGARVGIVGRTGSGKSTVVQTLFRLLEAEHGSICIDGVDISKLGLHALRTKLSVIPQVPTLFSGCTVRENLDLFGIHTDDEVRKALEDAHLSRVVEALPNGWDSMVSEGGTNFSVGQRQLLCLARAILNNSKICILDEATANIDRRTDELLQIVLHDSFKEGTLLAVAHRLETIIDYDFVLVLGHGHVLEFGPPADLIAKGGSFASMVNDTGDSMASDLRRRAMLKKQESDAANNKEGTMRFLSLGSGDVSTAELVQMQSQPKHMVEKTD